MYLAKMIEDGRKMYTKPFITIDEARREGRRKWQTIHFDIIEVLDAGVPDGVYEAIRYVPVSRTA
jgi:hypothetical protein